MNVKTYRFAITGDGIPYDVIVGAVDDEGAEVEVHRIIPTTATATLVSATRGTMNDFIGERTLNRVVMKNIKTTGSISGHGTG